jgi:hypothetical protein
MEPLAERVKIFVPLLAGAYLGFYVFGLVMSVFSPVEQWGLTAIAGVCVLGLVAYVIARRRGVDPIPATSPLAHSARAEREHRGF